MESNATSSTTDHTHRSSNPIVSSSESTRRTPAADKQATTSRDTFPCNDESLRRHSAFLEVGLGGDDPILDAKLKRESRPKLSVRFRSKVDIVESEAVDDSDTPLSTPRLRHEMPFFFPTLPRLIFLAFIIALVIPSLHTSPLLKVDANPVWPRAARVEDTPTLQAGRRDLLSHNVKRADTSTTVCKRWSQQSALVNGSLYLYSGRSMTSSSQTSNTWSKWIHIVPVVSLTENPR